MNINMNIIIYAIINVQKGPIKVILFVYKEIDKKKLEEDKILDNFLENIFNDKIMENILKNKQDLVQKVII